MTTHKSTRFLLIFATLFLVTAACALPIAQPGPGPAPQNEQTQAVQTLEVLMTQVASGSNTATPGSNPPPQATNTTEGQPTLRPSSTPIPTQTRVFVPTMTRIPPTAVCDMASFVSDVTIPDGSVVGAETSFTKTWKLKNAGTCTWTTDYALVFDSGASMGGPASQKLTKNVAPGDTIELSVTLTAPNQPGNHRGNWRLRNANNVLFGLGSKGASFYVDIKVISITPIVSDDSYEFTANYCLATWTGNDTSLPCNGTDGSSKGFVIYQPKPVLESGYIDDEPALLTNPPKVNDGVIRGKFPAYTVKEGDTFNAIIGCAHDATKCNVRFQLDYEVSKGGIQTFKSWNEVYDEKFTVVEEDLSSLVGKNVTFYLTVLANGASDNDRALWLRPRIASK